MARRKIKEHGIIFELNDAGYIINHLTKKNLQQKWQEVVDDIVKDCQEIFGGKLVSVYVRGSVAAGIAIPGFSDIDFILIFDDLPNDVEENVNKIREKHEKKYINLLSKVDLVVAEKHNLGRVITLLLSTQSVCVYGEDVAEGLPKTHITDAHQHREKISREIQGTLEALDEIDDKAALLVRERWIMSRVIRALFENVMVEARVYTRSLSLNAKYFAERYPQYEEDVYRFLGHAINPKGDTKLLKSELHCALKKFEEIKSERL